MTLSLITFNPGTEIFSAQVNANFTALVTGVVVCDGSGSAITGLCKIATGGGFQGNTDPQDRIGIATFGPSNNVEVISHSHFARISGGAGGGALVEFNVYNDGTNDRYLGTTTAPAYQLAVASSGVRCRKSTDASPTAGNTITWGSWTTLFS
jgi:hypothetical protein